ncbi:MAG TPA: 4-hydroxy-3-methylbut-2-enyl diphosphate reductase [Vineibacter sp.]|nr:4-hydroxy-3-methylbut-2-enyl diphosphate reductase [Vineibacter sp.]
MVRSRDKRTFRLTMPAAATPPLTILLASPRGFCAGVDRAIQIVERVLLKFGPPVYVRHEIVHNRFVVESLEAKGAVFIEELDQVPDGRPVVFSAHGVPKAVPAEAARRHLIHVDATCPLVSKVHRETEHHHEAGRTVILIGHGGHPEVVGTMGQLPAGAVILVETIEQAERLEVADADNLAFVTQTTLSVDDTAQIVAALQRRFPKLAGPRREDICYATTNRQAAVKAIATDCDGLIVIGAPNSSNSMRLVEVARSYGCPKAMLVQRAADMDWRWLDGVWRLGITAGASAPELLVEELIAACRARYAVTIEEVRVTDENTVFRLPRALVA